MAKKKTEIAGEVPQLKIVYKDIDALIPTEYNPKKCSPKEDEGIRASIQRFGLVDPVIVNVHPDRMNVIVGGHQRTRIAKSLGFTEMPCVEVNLPLDKEKELNVRLSKNTGSIDEGALATYFEKEFLMDIGFIEAELKGFKTEFEQEFEKYDDGNCAYPIVPKFSEKYDALIIVSTNDIDTTFLETVLGIDKAQSYKNSRTGKAMIISVDKFREQWEQK